jgi:hypothetical protein
MRRVAVRMERVALMLLHGAGLSTRASKQLAGSDADGPSLSVVVAVCVLCVVGFAVVCVLSKSFRSINLD